MEPAEFRALLTDPELAGCLEAVASSCFINYDEQRRALGEAWMRISHRPSGTPVAELMRDGALAIDAYFWRAWHRWRWRRPHPPEGSPEGVPGHGEGAADAL